MAGIILPNGYNVGTDAAVTISDAYGDVFTAQQLGLLTDFRSAADSIELKVTPITNGGIPVLQTIWNGVTGSMMFVRQGPAFQAFFLETILAYHQSGIIQQFGISMEVQNRDGSVDEYLLSGVQFTKPDFGNFAAVKEVDMSLAFNASIMTKAGGATTFLTGLAQSGGLQTAF